MAKKFILKEFIYKILSNVNMVSELMYPVGAVITNADSNFDPNNIIGTWTKETITKDYIVEEGTSGIWIYRKWNSGIAECWGKTAVTTYTHTTASGYGYYTSANFSFPTNLFTSVVVGFGDRQQGTGSTPANTLISINTRELTTDHIGVWVQSASSGSQSLSCSLHAKGYWKTYVAPTTVYKWTRTA